MDVLWSACIFTFSLTLHMKTSSVFPKHPCCLLLSVHIAFLEHLTVIQPCEQEQCEDCRSGTLLLSGLDVSYMT